MEHNFKVGDTVVPIEQKEGNIAVNGVTCFTSNMISRCNKPQIISKVGKNHIRLASGYAWCPTWLAPYQPVKLTF